MGDDQLKFDAVLAAIASRATEYDRAGAWPAEDLAELASIGAMRWYPKRIFGGEELDPLELHRRYQRIASASLATALVLSQRDSAVGFLEGALDAPCSETLSRALAAGEIFSTIGIAQLTTSRQGGAPALIAHSTAGGYRITGNIPWSTGAGKSQYVIAGATLSDGKQILFAMPTDVTGVRVNPPPPLVALAASWTTNIDCDDALIEDRWVLRGPVERALAGRSRGVPNGQAFLAMGLCEGALQLIAAHDSAVGRSTFTRFEAQLAALENEVLTLCGAEGPEAAAAAPRIRARCTALAGRITHAAVALYKGNALRLDHPAQRMAREAMFLLVWSCPDPVIGCTVDLLSEAALG
jgi:alkylation response protein AidB-like acyl-CoA dehydrogenase